MASIYESDETDVRPTYFRRVWRLHFYAGLFVAPVLVILSITGALYLFDREFDAWWYRDVEYISPGTMAHPLAEQEAAVISSYPNAVVRQVGLPRGPDRTSKWRIETSSGEGREVALNPYSLAILGETDPDVSPMAVIRKLHGELLTGKVGSYLVELTACWTLIMIVSGIYLWWPRRWKLKGVIIPRLQAEGRRRWRDLHAVPAIVNALFVLFLVLSGLPWSAFWGVQFAKVGEVIPFIAPSPNFIAHRPHSGGTAQGASETNTHAIHEKNAKQLPWVIENSNAPLGSGKVGIGIGDIEPHLSKLDRDTFGQGVRIFYPAAPDDVFMVSYVPDKAQGQRTIYVDQGTGEVIDNIGWRQYSPTAQVVEWGVMTHMGRQYGVGNQIAGVLVCSGIVFSVVAGVVLWWRRRPAGTLGAPPTEASDRIPAGLTYALWGIAILFPLVGASWIVVLVLEKIRKARSTAHA